VWGYGGGAGGGGGAARARPAAGHVARRGCPAQAMAAFPGAQLAVDYVRLVIDSKISR
jgi:hypothetical protein